MNDTAKKFKPKANITRPTRIKRPKKPLEDVITEKTGETTPEGKSIDSEASESVYQAYEIGTDYKGDVTKQQQLEIRKREDSGYLMPYSLVMFIGYAGDHTITLFCSFHVIIIEGKHLTELRELLDSRKVSTIQEFDPKQFNMKLDNLPEGTPVITEVKVKFGRA